MNLQIRKDINALKMSLNDQNILFKKGQIYISLYENKITNEKRYHKLFWINFYQTCFIKTIQYAIGPSLQICINTNCNLLITYLIGYSLHSLTKQARKLYIYPHWGRKKILHN